MVSKAFSFPHATLIGFDNILKELDRATAHATQSDYPRHNVVKHSNTHYTIELAVAGFKQEDLTIEFKDSELVVKGVQNTPEVEYLHKGISTRNFTKTFKLAEHVLVDSADLQNGLLVIDLKVEIPEEKKPQVISIGSKPELLTE